ncbi:PAS domain S-box protein [Microcoleus asticus]|uniref:histidine kinase n=1 Tax=Microcoleus asticus IPMA8 TaxID=2563858 RepID=A0ABX2CWN3_9CYAN|nr:PAS domain S-box protein [Microcoleus asticus]NQE34701.1 Aerobic respiration control sensor protein ArcB [Microcoleus asticus IPMA8]
MSKFPPEKTQPPHQQSTTAQVLRQAHFDAFFAGSNAGLLIFDRQLRYVQINEVLAQMNGICVADHIGRSVREVLPELAPAVEPMLQAILDTGKPILDYELVGETPKEPGILRYWQASYYPLLDENGIVFGLGGIVIEITDRKRAEQKQARLTAILEATSDLVGVVDATGHSVYLNKAGQEMLGMSPEEARSPFTIDSVLAPSARAKFHNDIIPTALREGRWAGEILFLSRDGEEIPVSQVLIVHKTEAGEVEFISTIVRDIREQQAAQRDRKTAEDVLKQSEERFRSLMEASAQIIWNCNADGEMAIEQPTWSAFTGQTFDDYKGGGGINAIHPDDRSSMFTAWSTAVANRSFYEVEFRMRRYDGEYRYMSCRGVPILEADGTIREWVGANTDITERKQAEEALRQQQAALRDRNFLLNSILESTPDIIVVKDLEGRYVAINSNVANFLGKSIEEIIGKDDLELMSADSARELMAKDRQVMAAGITETFEDEISADDETPTTFLTTKAPWRDANGNILGIIATSRDISDRKQVEADLRDRNALLNSILESTPDFIMVKDREGRHVALNSNLANFFGKPIEEIIGKDDLELLPPDIAREIMAKDRQIMAAGITESYEEEVSNHETSATLLTTKAPWRDANGNILGTVATTRDISDRKQAEEALRERNDLLNSILESTPDIIVVKDREGRYVAMNSNLANFLGKPIEEIIGKDDGELLSPESAREMIAKDRHVLAAGITEIYEEDVSQGETTKTFLTTKAPWRDANGNILGIIGTTRDISDRKKVEQTLRQTLEILDLASDSIIIRDMDDRIIYWNQGAEKLYGGTKAEVAGEFIHAFLETIFPKPLETLLAEFFEHGSWEGELHHTTRDDRHIIVASRWTLQRDAEGKPCAQLEINTDITDRKQAEDAIKQSEERYRSLILATSQMVWTGDAEGRCPDMPSMRAYTGQTEAEVVGFGWLDAMHPDDRERTAQVWMEAVQTKSLYDIEYRIRRADGNYRYFQGRGVPILNEDGSIREWVGTCSDIHDRKQAEDAIKQSEERYRSLTLAISQIVWTTDPEGRCQDSPSMRAYTGQTEAEVVGFGWLDAVHPDDRELTVQVWMEAVQTRSLFDIQYRMCGADGNYRYFQARGVPILNEDGSIREWVGTCTDIHDRKQAEEAIKQSEERYRSLIVATSQIVWAMDAEGRGTELQSWKAYTGQTEADVLGFGWLDPIYPDDRERTVQVWMEAVQTKTLFEIEYRIRRADGNYRYFQVRGVPILNEDGSVREWVGTCTDIHDRKQTEFVQAKAREAAEAANRAKSEFLANMSHELRTPLNGIMGYAQILQRSKVLNEEERSRIDVIYQCGSHLLTLINDILDLSKIEAQKVELMPTDFHFPAFLQGVAEMCRIRAELKGIHFHFPSSPELPIGIRADEKRLRQVLINLLSNAIKFTDEGSVTFIVSFATEGKIRFEIRDTGTGIAQDQLQAIFEPFEQVGDRRRQTEGTGLGLAISKKIVELMGSTIQVQSEMNVGSIFWFDVNLSQADEWVKTSQIDNRGQIIGIKDRQPKIVVIDDKWANRSVISNLLSPIGFEVSEANDGQEGWEKILEVQPDLIVTDLLMPELDGFELIKRVRESENFKDIVIIVSSASVFETDQYRSLEAGGNTFIPKPVQATELLQKLQQYLDLEWVYEGNEDPLAIASDTNELIAPPATEMEMLYELALKGNFLEIVKQASLLEEIDPKYIPFAKILHQMAKDFQDEEILTFIQSYK